LFIVTDRKLAEGVSDWLGQDLLRVIHPQSVVPKWKPTTILTYTPPEKERSQDVDPEVMRSYNTTKSLITRQKRVYEALKFILQMDVPSVDQLGKIPGTKKIAKRIAESGFKEKVVRNELQAVFKTINSLEEKFLSIATYRATSKVATLETKTKLIEALRNVSKTLSREDNLKVLSICKRAGVPESIVRSWYPGDSFDKNWTTAEKYGLSLEPGWLFHLARKHSR
jgi:hypothetical protein